MGSSKVALTTSKFIGKAFSFIGYLWSFIVLIPMFEGLTVRIIFEGMIWIAPGVACIVFGLHIKRRIKRYRNYVLILSANENMTVDTLASKTALAADFVYKDLQKMIDKKFFTNACIDANTREILIGSKTSGANNIPTSQPQAVSGSAIMESFNCPACSALGKKQKDTSGSCEYCGTIIS